MAGAGEPTPELALVGGPPGTKPPGSLPIPRTVQNQSPSFLVENFPSGEYKRSAEAAITGLSELDELLTAVLAGSIPECCRDLHRGSGNPALVLLLPPCSQ